MSRKLVGCGVVALVVCVSAGSAQAKLVRYEIDGKRYSYSTNNIQQTREARRRIEAANAASAAKARAEAERAANPIVRIFGSRTQREAAEAQTRLRETLASPAAPPADADFETTSSVKKRRAEARRENGGAKTRAERRQTLREARRERRRLAHAQAQKRAALSAETRARKEVAKPVQVRHRLDQAPTKGTGESIQARSEPPPKTSLPEREPAASLTEFVDQVRKAPSPLIDFVDQMRKP